MRQFFLALLLFTLMALQLASMGCSVATLDYWACQGLLLMAGVLGGGSRDPKPASATSEEKP